VGSYLGNRLGVDGPYSLYVDHSPKETQPSTLLKGPQVKKSVVLNNRPFGEDIWEGSTHKNVVGSCTCLRGTIMLVGDEKQEALRKENLQPCGLLVAKASHKKRKYTIDVTVRVWGEFDGQI